MQWEDSIRVARDGSAIRMLQLGACNREQVALYFGGAAAGEIKMNGQWKKCSAVSWGIRDLGPVASVTQAGDFELFLPADAQAIRFELKFRRAKKWTPLGIGDEWARYRPPSRASALAQGAAKFVSLRLYDRLWPTVITADSPLWKKVQIEVELSLTPLIPRY